MIVYIIAVRIVQYQKKGDSTVILLNTSVLLNTYHNIVILEYYMHLLIMHLLAGLEITLDNPSMIYDMSEHKQVLS